MKQPNIVLINCDDLGYGDIGCYGSTYNETPTVDYMAKHGLTLTDFYTGSPVCSPSRGGMMTGCYPPRVGFGSFEGEWVLFPGQGVGLNPKETTFARLLQQAGYRTKLVGKWHCGDQREFMPLRHGFDEYYGLPYSNDMGHQVGKEQLPPLPLIDGETVIQQQPDQCALTERYVEQSCRFIRENTDKPFFLYLAHMHVHRPLYAAESFVTASRNGDFGACVSAIDWATGCILRELEQQKLTENTLVIFTSDNGGRGDAGGSNAPLRGAKGTTWEGGQRVPCVLYWPGTIAPGRVSHNVLSNIDFFPTFVKLSGAEPTLNNKIDGLDFSALLFEESTVQHEAFYYYIKEGLEAVRVGDWKLHVGKNYKPANMLYNLKDDVGEQNNLYDTRPDIVTALMPYIEACRKDLGDSLTNQSGENVRPIGKVENPHPLTTLDENHPYIVMLYDRDDVG